MCNKQSFTELLMKNFSLYADRTALRDDRHPNGITYREVEELSGRVYAWLKKKGIGREQIVMVNMPRGLETVAVCFGVWRAGAAYTIAEEGYPKERTDFIFNDCGCTAVIDKNVYREIIETYDPLPGCENVGEHDAAYAAYTSGTTGNPKGVLHEMGQLMRCHESVNYRGEPFCESDDIFILLSPLNFVASTMVFILVFGSGARLDILPYDIVKNPVRLRDYMIESKTTGCFMTPSLVRAFTALSGEKDGAHPFNPEFRRLFLSSEPANRIFFDDIRIFNVYGQTEMGHLSNVFKVDKPYDVTPIGGSPIAGAEYKLCDEQNGMGELCVENPYFRGYINLPEMTEYAKRDGIYHTGDIARLDPDGEPVLLGRTDDMVKINGNRVEPSEIETAAKKVLGISWCAAKAFLKPDRAYICLYYTDDINFDENETISELSKYLPPYMIPTNFMKIGKIPLNANGKMDRKALPEPKIISFGENYEPPVGELEERLCKAFAQVLNVKRVGRNDDFYKIGGDSLRTIRLVSRLGLDGIGATDIFKARTVKNLAELYRRKIDVDSFKNAEERESEARMKLLPLTGIQKDFYDIQMKDPGSLMWVIPVMFFFEAPDKDRLTEAVKGLKKNHPIFGTVLTRGENGEITQKYDPKINSAVVIENGTEEDIADIRKTLRDPDLPFEMLGHPLAKIRLIQTEKGVYVFFLIHHILTDGTGILVLLNNFRSLYSGKEISLDSFYTYLENEAAASSGDTWKQSKRQMDSLYNGVKWTSQIAPVSQKRGEENGVLGAFTAISEEEMTELERTNDLSRTGLFAAVMIMSLAKYTEKRDILINWIFSNRGDARNDAIAGMIIRSLALGIRLNECEKMKDVYQSIKEQMLQNIACSEYEWCLHNPPEQGGDRLFFVYEGEITAFDRLHDIGGVQVPTIASNQAVVHSMSSQVLAWEKNDKSGYLLACYYISSMYNAEDMERFKAIMKEMSAALLTDPDIGSRAVSELLS